MASNAIQCERVQSENCFAAVFGTSSPPVINEIQTDHGASNVARRRAPSTKKPPCVALQHTGHWVPYDAKASPTINANIAGSVRAHHLCQRARQLPIQSFFGLGSQDETRNPRKLHKTQLKNDSLEFVNMIERV